MKKYWSLLIQFIKFGFVGGVCTVIDIGLLAFLKEVFGVDPLVAAAVSFSVSVVVNYLLSMKFVFKSKGESKTREFLVYLILSVIGLGLNQLIMWVGIDVFSVHYLLTKIIATGIVLVYNFVTRKVFIEKH